MRVLGLGLLLSSEPGSMDASKVGVLGFSKGGFTALNALGVGMDGHGGRYRSHMSILGLG